MDDTIPKDINDTLKDVVDELLSLSDEEFKQIINNYEDDPVLLGMMIFFDDE